MTQPNPRLWPNLHEPATKLPPQPQASTAKSQMHYAQNIGIEVRTIIIMGFLLQDYRLKFLLK
jgi:hypothetical protein